MSAICSEKKRSAGVFSAREENSASPLDLNQTLEQINKDIALRVLDETGGNQSATAKRLGVSRAALWRMIREV